MAADSLTNVLAILRQFKTTADLNLEYPTLEFMKRWAGTDDNLTIGRFLVSVQENVQNAQMIVARSRLTDEAKTGLLSTISSLTEAFSVGGLQNPVKAYIPSLDSAITNFAIVTSSLDIDVSTDALNDILKFTEELDEFLDSIHEFDLSDSLRETASRHILVLAAMLRNVQAVGFDAALASYYEMLLALRKERPAEPDNESKATGFWDQLKLWGGRLETISKVMETAGAAIPYIEKIPLISGF